MRNLILFFWIHHTKKIYQYNILAEGGIIISEHSIYEKMPEKIGNFVKYDERNYNKKIVTFYCYE